MNIKNKLKLISTYKFTDDYYSKRAYVREKYDITSKVLESRSDVDEEEDIPIVNEEVDNILHSIEIVNNAFTFNMLDRNGSASDGTPQLSYAEAKTIFGFDTAPVTLFAPKNRAGEFIGDASTKDAVGFNLEGGVFKSVTFALPAFKTISDKLTVVKDNIDIVKDVLSVKNFNKIYEYYNYTANGFLTAYKIFEEDRSIPQFIDGFDRDVSRATFSRFKDKVELLQKNMDTIKEYVIENSNSTSVKANTSDIYKENNLSIEFTSLGFDILSQDFNNFLYDTKTNPSPDGKALVKVPKINSFIFATPLKSTSYFVALASQYDQIDITVDNNMAMRIKQFLVNLKTDEAHLVTGKYEDQGINLVRTEMTTGLIENIKLESNVSNNYIELADGDIDINGTTGKIAIGLVGESSNISTPYDSDIKRMQAELVNLKLVYDRLTLLLTQTGIQYTVMKGSDIYFYNLGELLASINTRVDDYYLTQVTNYSEYRDIADNTFESSKALKGIVLDESWDKRLTGSSWDKPSFIEYNKAITDMTSLTNANIADLIAQTTVGATIPMRSSKKTEYTDFKPNTKSNLYSSFFNYLDELGLGNYLGICKDLVNAGSYYSEFQREREKSVNYCSPQEGATIISLYFTVEYISLNSSLNNLLVLQSQYKLTNSNSYELSLGSILKDMINTLNGSILSYTSVNPGTPPYTLQTTGAEGTFDDNIEELITNIDNLLL